MADNYLYLATSDDSDLFNDEAARLGFDTSRRQKLTGLVWHEVPVRDDGLSYLVYDDGVMQVSSPADHRFPGHEALKTKVRLYYPSSYSLSAGPLRSLLGVLDERLEDLHYALPGGEARPARALLEAYACPSDAGTE